MHHQICVSICNCPEQGGFIEDIDHYRIDACRAQGIAFQGRSRCTDNVVPSVEKQRRQPPANGSGRASQKYIHDRYSFPQAARILTV
jgi:hypothetical protein